MNIIKYIIIWIICLTNITYANQQDGLIEVNTVHSFHYPMVGIISVSIITPKRDNAEVEIHLRKIPVKENTERYSKQEQSEIFKSKGDKVGEIRAKDFTGFIDSTNLRSLQLYATEKGYYIHIPLKKNNDKNSYIMFLFDKNFNYLKKTLVKTGLGGKLEHIDTLPSNVADEKK